MLLAKLIGRFWVNTARLKPFPRRVLCHYIGNVNDPARPDHPDSPSRIGLSTGKILARGRLGHRAVVELLVDNGADISATDRFGFTPLSMAKKNNHADIVKYLKKRAPLNRDACHSTNLYFFLSSLNSIGIS